jgi:hypothetical protein
MKLAGVALLMACLGAAPAGAQFEKSLDDVDTGSSKSLDDVDTGASESLDDVPTASGEDAPDGVGAAEENAAESESLDAADRGTSETPDEIESAGAVPPPDAPVALGPLPPLEDGDWDAQSDAAQARVAQAKSNAAYWDHRYADMIRRGYPTGAARVALIQSRDQAKADLAAAEERVAALRDRAGAANLADD